MKIEESIPLHLFTHMKQVLSISPFVSVVCYLDHSEYFHCYFDSFGLFFNVSSNIIFTQFIFLNLLHTLKPLPSENLNYEFMLKYL